MNEFNNNTIGNPSNTYQTLGNYFKGERLLAMPPMINAAPTLAQNNVGNVIVPVFGGIPNSDQSGPTTNQSGRNYYTITSAYPNYPNTCGLVTSNLL